MSGEGSSSVTMAVAWGESGSNSVSSAGGHRSTTALEPEIQKSPISLGRVHNPD